MPLRIPRGVDNPRPMSRLNESASEDLFASTCFTARSLRTIHNAEGLYTILCTTVTANCS
jgi:hypothetical protein